MPPSEKTDYLTLQRSVSGGIGSHGGHQRGERDRSGCPLRWYSQRYRERRPWPVSSAGRRIFSGIRGL